MTRTLFILLPLALVACAGDRDSRIRGTETRNPLLEQLRGGGGQRPPEQVDLRAGARDLPAQWRDVIDSAWAVWMRHPMEVDASLDPRTNPRPDPVRLSAAQQVLDAQWAQARAQWLGLGPGAENLLVENLIRWYMLSMDKSDGYQMNRARLELAKHKPVTRAYLVQAIAQKSGDSVTRDRAGDLLAYLGDAGPVLEEAYDDAGDEGRKELARVLKKLVDPSTIPLLMGIADSGDPWQARVDALQALGQLEAAQAAPVFVNCLKDRDSSVRKFAARYAGSLGSDSGGLAQALVGTLEDAHRERDGDLVRASVRSLQRMTGQRLGSDPQQWRAILGMGGS